MLRKCKVSCTKNLALTRSQITENHRHRYRRCRTPHLKFVIDAEETRTPPTVADSRTRHVIIVERWAIFQELVARNNMVSQSSHPKHRRTLKSTLLSTENHRHRYRRCRTRHLKFVIDAEETRTPPTVADSRTRHVIIVERWAIFQELVARNNMVSQSNHPKHRRTLKSTLLSTVKAMSLKMF